jgi:DNA-binding winged helix-turn-helix (wHTH) protein
LRPKTASLLRAFLERPREVVTKAQLFEWVWPGICVVDNVLAQGIRELRAALGDDARAPRFLRTLPAAGYVWLTAVHAAPPDGARARAPSVGPSVGMDVDA